MSGEIVHFPLGSVLETEAADLRVMATAVREGLEDIIVVGINSDGDLSVICPPEMPEERTHYLLVKAAAMIGEIGEEDTEDEEESD